VKGVADPLGPNVVDEVGACKVGDGVSEDLALGLHSGVLTILEVFVEHLSPHVAGGCDLRDGGGFVAIGDGCFGDGVK
jgi:hypothetical protein